MQGALRELDYLSDPSRGEVRLGSMETLHAGLVCSTMEHVLRSHAGMRFVLESGQSPDLIHYFLPERLVEFVLARPYKLPLPPDIEGEPLFREHLRVVVGRTSPFAHRRRIELRELIDEYWILSRNELTPESPLNEAFAAQGLQMPRRAITSGSLTTRYNLLATGRFVTLIPHSVLHFGRHLEMLKVLPITLPPWQTPTMVLTLKGRTLGPAAHLFLAQLRELAKPLDIDRPTGHTIARPASKRIPART